MNKIEKNILDIISEYEDDTITREEILKDLILLVRFPDIFSYEYAYPQVRKVYNKLFEE